MYFFLNKFFNSKYFDLLPKFITRKIFKIFKIFLLKQNWKLYQKTITLQKLTKTN